MVKGFIWWFVSAFQFLCFIPIRLYSLRMTRYWLVFIGAWFTSGSFFLLAWIKFKPWRYANSMSMDLVSELILVVGEWGIFIRKLPEVMGFVSKFLSLSGLNTIVFLPTLNLFVRITLIAIAIAGAVGIIGFIIGGVVGNILVKRIVYTLLGFYNLIVLVLLVINLNSLDGWAVVGRFPSSLLPVLTGAELGVGPWMACVGLGFLIVASIWALAEIS